MDERERWEHIKRLQQEVQHLKEQKELLRLSKVKSKSDEDVIENSAESRQRSRTAVSPRKVSNTRDRETTEKSRWSESSSIPSTKSKLKKDLPEWKILVDLLEDIGVTEEDLKDSDASSGDDTRNSNRQLKQDRWEKLRERPVEKRADRSPRREFSEACKLTMKNVVSHPGNDGPFIRKIILDRPSDLHISSGSRESPIPMKYDKDRSLKSSKRNEEGSSFPGSSKRNRERSISPRTSDKYRNKSPCVSSKSGCRIEKPERSKPNRDRSRSPPLNKDKRDRSLSPQSNKKYSNRNSPPSYRNKDRSSSPKISKRNPIRNRSTASKGYGGRFRTSIRNPPRRVTSARSAASPSKNYKKSASRDDRNHSPEQKSKSKYGFRSKSPVDKVTRKPRSSSKEISSKDRYKGLQETDNELLGKDVKERSYIEALREDVRMLKEDLYGTPLYTSFEEKEESAGHANRFAFACGIDRSTDQDDNIVSEKPKYNNPRGGFNTRPYNRRFQGRFSRWQRPYERNRTRFNKFKHDAPDAEVSSTADTLTVTPTARFDNISEVNDIEVIKRLQMRVENDLILAFNKKFDVTGKLDRLETSYKTYCNDRTIEDKVSQMRKNLSDIDKEIEAHSSFKNVLTKRELQLSKDNKSKKRKRKKKSKNNKDNDSIESPGLCSGSTSKENSRTNTVAASGTELKSSANVSSRSTPKELTVSTQSAQTTIQVDMLNTKQTANNNSTEKSKPVVSMITVDSTADIPVTSSERLPELTLQSAEITTALHSESPVIISESTVSDSTCLKQTYLDDVKVTDSNDAAEEKVTYAFFDNNDHRCKPCQLQFTTLSKFLLHISQNTHQSKITVDGLPWQALKTKHEQENMARKASAENSSNSKLVTLPAGGIEYMYPVNGFFCKLCQVFSCDSQMAEEHLLTKEHNLKLRNQNLKK